MSVEADTGYSVVPNWVVRDSDLTKYELLVFIALLNRANSRGEAWPSLATLEREARASRDSVLRALRTLEERGLVDVVKRYRDDGSQTSNLYVVRPHLVGSLTATGGVAGSDGGSRWERPEVHTREVHTEEDLLFTDESANEPDRFDEFWSIYPRRQGKGDARKAWAKALKSTPADVIIAGASRYAQDPHREATYTKLAGTWLRAECWEDEPLPPRQQVERVAGYDAAGWLE